MDLKQFVADSLTQIIDGVRDAQQRSKDSGAWFNPAGYGLPRATDTIEVRPDVYAYVHDVEFDVAITATDTVGGKAGAGIKVLGAHIGAGGDMSHEDEAASRIQFSIPVVWPIDVNEQRERANANARAAEDARVAAMNRDYRG